MSGGLMEGLLPGAVTLWDTPWGLAPPRGSHPDHRETKELLAGLDGNFSLWSGGGREGEVSCGLGRVSSPEVPTEPGPGVSGTGGRLAPWQPPSSQQLQEQN